MQIALISDTHIATNPDALCYYQKPTANLEKVVKAILQSDPLPEAIFHAGDVSFMSGQPGDYQAACGILEPIGRQGIPIHYVMGNHDQLNQLSGNMAPDVVSPLPNSHMARTRLGGITWLTIDTAISCGEVTGRVGEATIGWIKDQLEENPEEVFIVVGHHHPNDPLRTDVAEEKGLVDTDAFLAFLDLHPRLIAYVHGHTHAWRSGMTKEGTWLINLPATSWSFDEVRPHGWVMADVEENEITLTLHCLEADHPQEGQTVRIPVQQPALL